VTISIKSSSSSGLSGSTISYAVVISWERSTSTPLGERAAPFGNAGGLATSVADRVPALSCLVNESVISMFVILSLRMCSVKHCAMENYGLNMTFGMLILVRPR